MDLLEQRAEQFTKIITDVAMDSDDMARSNIYFDELRPVRDEDLPEVAWHIKSASPAGFFCYEDAGMTTGGFLASQSLRFKTTAEPEAKANADRAFEGIRHIYNLGKEKAEGYFPKPYDKKISDQISRDQYIFVLSSLSEYYDIVDEKTRDEIKRMMARMAEYWIGIDYTDSYCRLPPASHLNDFMGSLFLAIIRFPYTYTGDKKFLEEYNRLFSGEKLGPRMPETLRAQFLRGQTYDGAMYFRQNENCIMLKTIAIDHLWDNDPRHRDLWTKSLKAFHDEDLLVEMDRESGQTYLIVGFDPEKNERFLTEPGIIEELEDPLELEWIRFGGLRKTAGSTQVAYAAAVIGDRLKLQESVDVARMILEKMELEKFRSFTVPDESHLPPNQKWEAHFSHSLYFSVWLWTYWLGRHRKLW